MIPYSRVPPPPFLALPCITLPHAYECVPCSDRTLCIFVSCLRCVSLFFCRRGGGGVVFKLSLHTYFVWLFRCFLFSFRHKSPTLGARFFFFFLMSCSGRGGHPISRRYDTLRTFRSALSFVVCLVLSYSLVLLLFFFSCVCFFFTFFQPKAWRCCFCFAICLPAKICG